MYRRILLCLVCAAYLTACNNTPDTGAPPSRPVPSEPSPTDPGSFTMKQLVESRAEAGNISAQAVISSGLYDALSAENYPLMLVLVPSNEDMEQYLKEQGLSQTEFLDHPKLLSFMERHLIDEFVDTVAIRSTQNTTVTHTSLAGSEVVFTTQENLDPQQGDVMFANGVPVSPYCTVSGNGAESVIASEGQLCRATAPIVQDFDWSQ